MERILEPRKPRSFDKPAGVYLSTLLPMALMYGVRNFEYTYGYTREGQIYYEEYFPGALEELYRGKRASLYFCEPNTVTIGAIPNEVVSTEAVAVAKEIEIPDVLEALREQERLGNLLIRRFEELLSGFDIEFYSLPRGCWNGSKTRKRRKFGSVA